MSKFKKEAAELLGQIAVDLRDDYYLTALEKTGKLIVVLTVLAKRKNLQKRKR